MKEDPGKNYVDSLSTLELYEEFQRIVNTYLGSAALKTEEVRILTEVEAAILTRILELHLLNLQGPKLTKMAEQIKNFPPHQKTESF